MVDVFGVKRGHGQLNKIQSKTFCMHPFTGLATREDGAIQVCCRSHPIGFIQDATLEHHWNGETMTRIRRQVLQGERPSECEPCFRLEDQGVESLRQRHIAGKIPEARINLYPDALDKMQDGYTMPFEIPTMELKLNNLCNLKCRMCHPGDSTSWNDWSVVKDYYKEKGRVIFDLVETHNLEKKPLLDKFENNEQWWASLEKNLPYFRRVEFAGGEPLMDPQHYRILDMLKPYGHQIEIKYATNGTTLGISKGRTIHDYWPHFRSVAVNVSIDGIGDVYNYIRGNADWNQVVDNVKEIQKIPNVSRVVGAVAVQVSNVMQLDKMIEYFLNDLGIIFYTNMVSYPDVLCIQVLPEHLKEQATINLNFAKMYLEDYKLIKEHPMLLDLTLKQIDGVINFMWANDLSDKWQQCINFNQALDATRNQYFFKVNSDYDDYE